MIGLQTVLLVQYSICSGERAYVAMVLFALALVQPTLPEGHPLLQHMRPTRHLLLVSSVDSGTIAGTASGQCHHVIVRRGSGFDCQ